MTADPPIRVLVADDHPMYREALVRALASDRRIVVVAAVGDGRSALRELRAKAVDVALLDLRLPDLDGLAVLRALRLDGLPARVVFVSSETGGDAVHAAVTGGAIGYLTKTAGRDAVRNAVLAAADGGSTFDDAAVAGLADAVRRDEPAEERLDDALHEVLRLIARGLTTNEIATRLRVPKTDVQQRTATLYARLGVNSRAAATARAIRAGLLDPGDLADPVAAGDAPGA